MSVDLNVFSLDTEMKELYPAPGMRIKQWVVEHWDRIGWERRTCPVVSVPDHIDNCDGHCRNVGTTPWVDLDHDSCYVCGDLYAKHAGDLDIAAWRMERAGLPPICADRDKLSDHIQPMWRLSESPVFKLMRKYNP